MSKMRVYEYAKEHHVSSKVIITKLEELGFDVKSHMSIIADNAINQLNRKMNGGAASPVQKVTAKPNKNKAEGPVNQTKTKEKKPTQTTSNLRNTDRNTNSRPAKARSGETGSGRKSTGSNPNNNERNRFGGNGNNNYGGRRSYGNRNRNNRRRGAAQQANRQRLEIKLPEKIMLSGSLTVGQFAEKLGRPSTDIIKKLMALGVMATKNQDLDKDTIELLANDYGVAVEEEVFVDEASFEDDVPEIDEKTAVIRPPVVTIMGHVDHGKTTLLDSIRHTKVTAGEAGGITQHIGAYQIVHNDKKITFLDTPGHAAFTTMRARGAEITDITVLVVAADDGVMPQTIEAIHHARAAKVPIIVAVNKIDKPNANPDHVMQELSDQGLVPEDWGGDTIFVKISAKKGTGIDDLLEMILLVAEIEEFKANPENVARGAVIEAELDKGKGPIATLLVQNGSLHIGDPIVVGNTFGRVRAMVNDLGRRVKKATPSTPVEITGLNNVPQAGDQFVVFDDEKKARQIGEIRAERALITERKETKSKVSLDDLFEQIKEGDMKEINLVIKADVQGSVEALSGSLKKIDVDGVKINIIHAGAGGISESDIILASASNAIIIGFNVRPDNHAQKVAEEEKVDIRLYRVIYDAIDEMEAAMKGMLDPEFKEKVIGQLEVRTTFKVSKIGTIAGCYVTDGLISRDAGIRLVRNGVVIYEGHVDTLKRFKDDAKEVKAGFECGLTLENFNDIKEGDTMEAYVMEEIKPK
ncbi:translation initiation factor IF-2 [Sporolactobacillus nakayamae]|uniref:Translation initiation factor IF-2 n=1 Tax=Sporolactobacillus nakayamae TaxID=269670 RepID=A0A1I2NCH4_9BACL|nr:translation initiation factor IF-2 [Sporolactobacillus nakayamae]SFG00780.1 translation initiation factor IF-2 [Sporolactobacillus nakayamae]